MNDKWLDVEFERFKDSLELHRDRISPRVARFLVDAYRAQDWDWHQSDGCTGASEIYWPSQFFPPCVGHDYQCVRANRMVDEATRLYASGQKKQARAKLREANKTRRRGDRLFYYANRAYGVSWPRSAIRWLAVRLWWIFGVDNDLR